MLNGDGQYKYKFKKSSLDVISYCILLTLFRASAVRPSSRIIGHCRKLRAQSGGVISVWVIILFGNLVKDQSRCDCMFSTFLERPSACRKLYKLYGFAGNK